MQKIVGFLLFVCLVSNLAAQKNKFLDRSFWSTNPTIPEIENLIAEGHDIAELNSNMFDPVCYALLEKVDNETVKYMIAKEGNAVDKITHDGRTYIFWAAYRNNLEMMQYLVDNGAKANIKDSHGYTVLNFAANTGQTNPKLYDFLLAHDADINATNHTGANALLLVAPYAEDFGVLNYFVDKGLSLNGTDDHKNGVFQYAAKGGHLPVLKMLVDKDVDFTNINKKGENAVFMAAQGTRRKQNSLAVFEYLESLGLKLNTVNIEQQNPLHLMTYRNTDIDAYKHFLEKGIDVNLQDKEGRTPFMNAVQRNELKIVQLLAKHISEIDIKDEKGRTALALAVQNNDPRVVEFLIDKGASIKVIDAKGNSLAYYLLKDYNARDLSRFENKLNLLQQAGLDLNQKQHDGNTLLHLAAKENDLSLLKRLEPFDLDINEKNDEGNTVLHIAAMTSENDGVLKYLIDKGANKMAKTEFDESVYDLAIENELLRQNEVKLDFLK